MTRRNGRNPKSPAYQWYPSDALADGRYAAMSAEEVGVYHLLLDHCWIDGSLPDDAPFLARLARLPLPRFRRAWKLVGQCFAIRDDGRLVNPRQERERTFQGESRARRQLASRAAIDAREAAERERLVHQSYTNRATDGPLTRDPIPETLDPRPYSHTQERSDNDPAEPDPGPEIALSRSALEHLSVHPTLDVPDLRAAVQRWEKHLVQKKPGGWSSSAWEVNLLKWERWGIAETIRNIDLSIESDWTKVHPPFADRQPAKNPGRCGPRSMREVFAEESARTVDVEGGAREVS